MRGVRGRDEPGLSADLFLYRRMLYLPNESGRRTFVRTYEGDAQ